MVEALRTSTFDDDLRSDRVMLIATQRVHTHSLMKIFLTISESMKKQRFTISSRDATSVKQKYERIFFDCRLNFALIDFLCFQVGGVDANAPSIDPRVPIEGSKCRLSATVHSRLCQSVTAEEHTVFLYLLWIDF
jgi:hypothetical protein